MRLSRLRCLSVIYLGLTSVVDAQDEEFEQIQLGHPQETAEQVHALVHSFDWKAIFMRSFTYQGPHHSCMSVCNDNQARACRNRNKLNLLLKVGSTQIKILAKSRFNTNNPNRLY